MSSGTEKEYHAVSACKFVKGKLDPNSLESLAEGNEESWLDCIQSVPGSSIRIPPMERIRIGGGNARKGRGGFSAVKWKDHAHFHPDLALPAKSRASVTAAASGDLQDGLLLQFQAQARECLAVALSAVQGYQRGYTYEVHFGDKGNTATKLVQSLRARDKKHVHTVMEASRVCHERAWISYWVCLSSDGRLFAGIGNKPGEQCVAILEKEEPHRKHEDKKNDGDQLKDAEKDGEKDPENNHDIAGVGPKSTIGEKDSGEIGEQETRDDEEKGKAGENDDDGKQAASTETGDADAHRDEGKEGPSPEASQHHDKKKTAEKIIRFVGFGNSAVTDRQAPTSLRVRNIRLSTLPESLQQRLATLERSKLDAMISVTTGDATADLQDIEMDESMDLETKRALEKYQEECRKAKARAEKFGVPYKEPPPPDRFIPWSQARRLRANPTQGFITGLDLQTAEEKAKVERRKARFGVTGDNQQDKQEVSASGDDDINKDKADSVMVTTERQSPVEQAWDNEKLVRSHRADPPPRLWVIPPEDLEAEQAKSAADEFAMQVEEPKLVPEKIHIFSIDWAAFKQIRTNDIMAHFNIYGPSYVEWLGDLSANVHFADQYSAARALENLSQPLPSPPPSGESCNEKSENSEKQSEENHTDEPQEPAMSSETEPKVDESPPDLGRMGWRLGKTLLLKIADDRYGRRGTTARLLFRIATTLDVLQERPSTWPKPPPGFTTKLVLGPGSDFPRKTNHDNQKRRRENRSDTDRTAPSDDAAKDTAKELLDQGLRAGRKGFTVEEMEEERARKKQKT